MPNINAVNTSKVSAISLDLLENQMNFVGSINQKYGKDFTGDEAIGSTLTIRGKLSPEANTTQTAAPRAFNEDSRKLTINKRVNNSSEWETLETELDIRNFMDREGDRMVCSIAAKIEKDNIEELVRQTPIYSAANTSIGEILFAKTNLVDQLADTSNLHCMMNPYDEARIVDGMSTRFNDQEEISKQNKTGELGWNYGMMFKHNTQLLNFETGSSTDRIGALTAAIADGDQVASVGGFTASSTIKAGEVFTIPGIYEVNPQSKFSLTSTLKQFVVATDTTLDGTGAGDLPLVEPVYWDSTNNFDFVNTSAEPTSGLVATLKGAADSSYRQNVIYDPEFAAVAFIKPKGKLGNIDTSTQNKNGIAIRYGQQGDLSEDQVLHRWDTYHGRTILRKNLAIRVIDFN